MKDWAFLLLLTSEAADAEPPCAWPRLRGSVFFNLPMRFYGGKALLANFFWMKPMSAWQARTLPTVTMGYSILSMQL